MVLLLDIPDLWTSDLSTHISQIKKFDYKSVYRFSLKVIWPFFLVLLPVTSFPYFPNVIGGGAIVRPLALYPLIFLTAVITIPEIIRKPIPKTFISLIPFITIATASSLISLTIGIEPILGISISERTTRNLLTLGIGIAIFAIVSLLPKKFKHLDTSLRWIYLGGIIALFWGSLQAVYVIQFNNTYYQILNQIQSHFSTRKLIDNRISGFTYEPNWFAEQIVLLFIPFLIASVINRHSVFQWRWKNVTIEKILLVWAIVVLPFTYSRAGLLNLVLLAALSLLVAFLTARMRNSRNNNDDVQSKNGTHILRSTAIAITLLLILLSIIFFAGSRNTYFARIWDYWSRENISFTGYLDYLGFGARLAYGEAAINTFKDNPFIGVGLGNYAFYFEDMLPERPLSESPELLHLIVPEPGRNRLITSKIFFLRLLAETGAVGISAFFAFFIAVAGCALYLWLSDNDIERFWGTAGVLGLFSFLVASLSFDSFAIPNMWMIFGIITCAAWIATKAHKIRSHNLIRKE